jgi:hypothetical protein
MYLPYFLEINLKKLFMLKMTAIFNVSRVKWATSVIGAIYTDLSVLNIQILVN